jgi:hypothetical protein
MSILCVLYADYRKERGLKVQPHVTGPQVKYAYTEGLKISPQGLALPMGEWEGLLSAN